MKKPASIGPCVEFTGKIRKDRRKKKRVFDAAVGAPARDAVVYGHGAKRNEPYRLEHNGIAAKGRIKAREQKGKAGSSAAAESPPGEK